MMGEKVTHVQPLLHSGVRIQIGGYLIRGGHVDYGEAVAIARRHHERQMQRSAEALAALERGDVEVHHQSGVHTPRNRRRVDPPADCLTAGCNQDDPGGWCSRCGYRPSDLPAETSTLTDKETPVSSNLADHARRELELCGQYAEDPEYAESIVAAVEAFASFGHSGGSAAVAREQLYTLLGWGTLSPLTSAPDEWEDRSEESGYPMWQSRRDPAAFSDNGGKTWWHLDDKEAPVADVDPRLTALMDDCGRALYDDREWNAPVYDEQGEIVGGNGANPFEAAFALDAVAQILGIEGPTAVHDRLCESEACPAHEPVEGGGDGDT